MKIFKKFASVILSLSIVFPAITMFKSNYVEAHFSQQELEDKISGFLAIELNNEPAGNLLDFCQAICGTIENKLHEDNDDDDRARLDGLLALGIAGLSCVIHKCIFNVYIDTLLLAQQNAQIPIPLPQNVQIPTLHNVLTQIASSDLQVQNAHDIFDNENTASDALQVLNAGVSDNVDLGGFIALFPHCTFSHNDNSVSGVFHQFQQLDNYPNAIGSYINGVNNILHVSAELGQTAQQSEQTQQ